MSAIVTRSTRDRQWPTWRRISAGAFGCVLHVRSTAFDADAASAAGLGDPGPRAGEIEAPEAAGLGSGEQDGRECARSGNESAVFGVPGQDAA